MTRYTTQTIVHLPGMISPTRTPWTGTLGELLGDDDAFTRAVTRARERGLLPAPSEDEDDETTVQDVIAVMDLALLRDASDDPNAELVGSVPPPSTRDDVEVWLGGTDATEDQVYSIIAAWERLAGLLEDVDEADPDREAALVGAGSYIMGDTSLRDVGASVRIARETLSRAMARLQGVMVAANLAGVPETQITDETGINRMTVRARIGK